MSHTRRRIILPFFFNDTATTEIYTLSLHDALPILPQVRNRNFKFWTAPYLSVASAPLFPKFASGVLQGFANFGNKGARSEEHTSELQSHLNLVCRLLLEKKNTHLAHHTPVPSEAHP